MHTRRCIQLVRIDNRCLVISPAAVPKLTELPKIVFIVEVEHVQERARGGPARFGAAVVSDPICTVDPRSLANRTLRRRSDVRVRETRVVGETCPERVKACDMTMTVSWGMYT